MRDAEPRLGDSVLKHFPGYGNYWGKIIKTRDVACAQPTVDVSGVAKMVGKGRGLGCSKCRWRGCSACKPREEATKSWHLFLVEYEDGDSEEYTLADVRALIRNAKESERLRNGAPRSNGTFRAMADGAFEQLPLEGGRFKRRRIRSDRRPAGKWRYFCRYNTVDSVATSASSR